MKKIILLLSLVQFVILTSCNKEVSTPTIVGKWNWVESTAPIATLSSYGPINKGANVTLEFFSNSTYTISENGNIIDQGSFSTGINKNLTNNIDYSYYKLAKSALPVPYLIYNYNPKDFIAVNELPFVIKDGIMEVDFSLIGISGYGKIRYKKI